MSSEKQTPKWDSNHSVLTGGNTCEGSTRGSGRRRGSLVNVVLVEEEEGGGGTARISDHNRLQKNLSAPHSPPTMGSPGVKAGRGGISTSPRTQPVRAPLIQPIMGWA